MKAQDVMVSPVITVSEGATVREVAKILIEQRVSGVPVLDGTGKLVGIVSEGDLLHRVEAGTERRRPWWLEAFAGEWTLETDYVKAHALKVCDVMRRNVITAAPETPLYEIAELLEKHQIKRVPIVSRGGDLVGIVSRANLVRAIAATRPPLEIPLSDSTIRQKIMDELKRQPWSRPHRLNITVTNGVVELWGAIESEQERKAIRVAAETVPGTVEVNDHLINDRLLAY